MKAQWEKTGESDSRKELKPPFRILPVPTRVEIGSERLKREVALALAQTEFAPFIEGTPGRYWGSVQLPYFAFYAFEEIPAVFGDLANDDLSLLTRTKHIAREITGDSSFDVAPFHVNDIEAERLRKEALGWYLRKTPDEELDMIAVVQRTYAAFDTNNQQLMKQVLLRLVQVTPSSPPSPLTCMMTDLGQHLQDMARTLATAGILQTSGAAIYIADRKVAENWSLLQQWAKEDEAFLMWRQGLTTSARQWRGSNRDASALLRGRFLEDAQAWMEERRGDLTENERDFITASEKGKPAEAVRIRLAIPGTKLQVQLSSLALIAVLVFLTGSTYLTYFYRQSMISKERADRAAAIVALAQKFAPADPLLSVLLLEETEDYAPAAADRSFAMDLAAKAHPERILNTSSAVYQFAFSPDGKLLATASGASTEIWSLSDGRRIAEVPVPAYSVSFNGWFPERAKLRGAPGQIDRIVITGIDGRIHMWTLDGKELLDFDAANLKPTFLPDCQNSLAPKKISSTQAKTLDQPAYALFSPDEVVIIVAYQNGPLVMISPDSGRCFDIHVPAATRPLVFSPDGEWAAYIRSNSRGTLTLFHVQDWKQQNKDLRGVTEAVLAVSSNGRALVAMRLIPGTVFWDREQAVAYSALSLSPGNLSYDGKLAGGYGRGQLDLTDYDSGRNSKVEFPVTDPFSLIEFDHNGTYVVTATSDYKVQIWPLPKVPPSPLAPWKDFVAFFRESTSVCLTASQRNELLNEDPMTAKSRAEACAARSHSSLLRETSPSVATPSK